MAKTRKVWGGSAIAVSLTVRESSSPGKAPVSQVGVSQVGGGQVRVGRAAVAKLAVLLMLGAGLSMAGCRRMKSSDATPNGPLLRVEMGTSTKLDPESALRCFVHGQFVGMQTPAQCAEKNGVPPGALDVGLDQSGSLAAGAGDAHLAPIANTVDDKVTAAADAGDAPSPPTLPAVTAAPSTAPLPTALAADGAAGDCLRFIRGGWQPAGQGVALGVCVRTLFAGRCVGPGQTLYGHWGRETLRLLPGRVEMSDNNRDFHPLVAQSASDCSLPPL